FFFSFEIVLLCRPGCSEVARSWLTVTSAFQVQVILLPQSSKPCLANFLIFIFLVEIGFHHVGQVGLELLPSSDPLPSASQRVGITSVSHCTWPFFLLINGSLRIRKTAYTQSTENRYTLNIPFLINSKALFFLGHLFSGGQLLNQYMIL
uniref:Uncharacterized protein n=1 Tax=Macaca mulatta TaxID=9544 RepID=A0A5F7ZAZ1_MACMU